MAELGIDLSAHHSKSVQDIVPGSVRLVITLCAEEVCPVFLDNAERWYWPLPDPAGVSGSHETQLQSFREVRDEIARRLEAADFRAAADSLVLGPPQDSTEAKHK